MTHIEQNLKNKKNRTLQSEPTAHEQMSTDSQTKGAKSTIKPKEVYKCAQGVKIIKRTPQGAAVTESGIKPKILLLKHKSLGAGMQAPVVVPVSDHDAVVESKAIFKRKAQIKSKVRESSFSPHESIKVADISDSLEPEMVTAEQVVKVNPKLVKHGVLDSSATVLKDDDVNSASNGEISTVEVASVPCESLHKGFGIGKTKRPSATAQAAAEAMQMLKDLEVLKKVKEFNALQRHEDDERFNENNNLFSSDEYEDDNDSLNGMHVVRGDRDHARNHYDEWEELPEDYESEFDYNDADFDEDFEHSAFNGTLDQLKTLNGNYKSHGVYSDGSNDIDDSIDDDYALADESAMGVGYSNDEDQTEDEDEGLSATSSAKATMDRAAESSSRALVSARYSSGGNTIGAFIKAVQQVPMLTEEEEKELAQRLKDDDDIEAARRLVMSHLRLVVSIARGFNGYGLPLLDLIQEGNIGLMKAVRHFDPDEGVRLAAFAVHWIKSEIHEYVIRNWRMVKVATTKAQRRLFFKLRQSKTHLGWMSNQERQQLADMLGVTTHEVAVMETRMSGSDIGFDLDESDNDKGMAVTMSPSSYLEDENSNFAQVLENSDYSNWEATKLYEALNTLDSRSRYIIKRRWLDEEKATLQELSGELKVSIERVRQLENNAMKKLKGMLLSSGISSSEYVDSGHSLEPLCLPHIPTPALTYKPKVAIASRNIKTPKATKRTTKLDFSEPSTIKSQEDGAKKAYKVKSSTKAKVGSKAKVASEAIAAASTEMVSLAATSAFS